MVLIETPTKLDDIAGWEAAIEVLRGYCNSMESTEYDVLMSLMLHGLALAHQPVPPSHERRGGIRERLTRAKEGRARHSSIHNLEWFCSSKFCRRRQVDPARLIVAQRHVRLQR